jgi:hypothetical protein
MMATILMYINAAFALLEMLAGGYILLPFLFVLVVGPVAAGWGIANEKKWGYWLGLVLAVVAVAWIVVHFSAGSILNLLFYGALVALLLHRQSREYRRIWFR